MPRIEPKLLSLPNEPYYPIERLFLFDRFTRASWEKTFGEQPPPWDRARRIKRWADSTALEKNQDLIEYTWFDFASGEFKRMVLTAQEAATPNLPGKFVYPKWVPAPTPAVVVGPSPFNETPINPAILCHREEAEELARELGALSVVEGRGFEVGPFRIDWRGETRRQWLLEFDGKLRVSAAALLAQKYRAGVGAPGKWVMEPSGPVWVSVAQDTGEQDTRPEVPIPCRPLFPEEAIHRTPFGYTVYRKDRESPFNPRGDVAILERIDANVRRLLDLFTGGYEK